MPIRPDHDPLSNHRRRFEAAWARHEATVARARRVHELRVSEARRRIQEVKLAHRAHVAEMQRRLAEALRLHGARYEHVEWRWDGWPFPPQTRRGRRPDGEDREMIPAVPAPKPKPLMGGAEAPIE
jgi:hypothetical protein